MLFLMLSHTSPPLLLASYFTLPFPCLHKPSALGHSKALLCPLQLGALGFTTLPPPCRRLETSARSRLAQAFLENPKLKGLLLQHVLILTSVPAHSTLCTLSPESKEPEQHYPVEVPTSSKAVGLTLFLPLKGPWGNMLLLSLP